MKAITKDLLLKVVQESSKSDFTISNLKDILEAYGNDWYIVDGQWKKID